MSYFHPRFVILWCQQLIALAYRAPPVGDIVLVAPAMSVFSDHMMTSQEAGRMHKTNTDLALY